MRWITTCSYHLMTPIEELSREETTTLRGKCLNLLCFQTFADKLWTPFRLICFNPIISLGVFLILYLLFTLLFLPLWLLSFILTSYGSFVVFLLLFHYFIIYVARLIAFPGSNPSSQKSMAQDFWKRILSFLENITIQSNQYASTMLLIANGQLPVQEIYTNMQELQKILMMIEHFPNMILYLQDSMDYCKSEEVLTILQLKVLNDFIQQLEQYYQSFHYLYHFLNEEYYHISSHSTLLLQTSSQQHYHHQQKNQRLLLTHASKCLKSSEAIRVLTQSLRPEGAGGNNNSNNGNNLESDEEGGLNQNNVGLQQISKLLCSFRETVNGFEHITFPYMRSILVHKFSAKIYLMKGTNDGNTIDGVYINAYNTLELRQQPVKRPTPSQSNKTKEESVGYINNQQAVLDSYQKGVDQAVSATNNKGLSIHVPVKESASTLAGDASNTTYRARGIVLFCNPNAAFYETVSQQEFDRSWVGYYINLGYDLFFYNYRGYGRSTGAPSPTTLRADGQCVADFLKKEFPQYASNMIVHGESIGGMIACSIAANPVNHVAALICDRTFASLDATASRLMGSWAGNFLKHGALWNTNVVNDYLNAACPKLVLQDPADEIINEAASLKSGISYKLCLNDQIYSIPQPSTDYAIAYYLKEETPNQHLNKEIIDEIMMTSNYPAKTGLQLSQRFIIHFYYCFLRIAFLSTQDSFYYHSNTTGGGNVNISQTGNSNAVAGIQSDSFASALNPLSQIEMIQKTGGLSSSTANDFTTSGAGGGSANKRSKNKILSNSSAELSQSIITEESGHSNRIGPNLSSKLDSLSGSVNTSNSSNSTSGMPFHSLQGPSGRKAKLEDFLSLKMTDSSFEGKPLLPFKKAFIALYRITNGSDYLLGQAVSQSLDAVRSWLCGYLVWNAVNIKDHSQLVSVPLTPIRTTAGQQKHQPKSNHRSPKEVNRPYRKTVTDAMKDLQQVMEQLHPESVGQCEELKFLYQAIGALWKKQQSFFYAASLPSAPPASPLLLPSSSSAFAASKSLVKSLSRDELSTLNPSGMMKASNSHQRNDYYHQEGGHGDEDLESAVPLIKPISGEIGTSNNSKINSQAVISSPKAVSDFFSLNNCSNCTACFQSSSLLNSNSSASANSTDINSTNANHIRSMIGDLLPLHTGHNGWLHSYEQGYMTEWLRKHHLVDHDE